MDSTSYSSRYVWYVVGLLTVVNVFNYMDRMALSVLLPLIKSDLHISDTLLGALTGYAFFAFYAICAIPVSRWADRGSRAKVIALSLVVWSVMTAATAGARNFWHLCAARVGVAAGEAGCLPAAQSIICDYVPLKDRSGVFALHTFGLFAGMMIGMVLAGQLGERIGWRLTFMVLGLPGIALASVVWATLREPMRGALDPMTPDEKELPTLGATIRTLWACRTYRVILYFVMLNGFVQFGLNQWWPSFYVRLHGLSLSVVGTNLGIAWGLGSGIGLLAGGMLSQKLGQRSVRRPLVVSAWLTALSVLTAGASLFVSSHWISLALVLMTGVCWTFSGGPVVAAGISVVAPNMRSTSGALSGFAASVVGFALGPFCVGALSDFLDPLLGHEALRYALLLPICLIPGMVLSLFAAAKVLPGDLQRAARMTPATSGGVRL